MPRKKKSEAITITRELDSEVMSTPPIVLTADDLVGGTFTIRPGVEVPVLLNTVGKWSAIGWRIGDLEMGDVVIDPDGARRMVGGKPIGYTALLLPLRSEFPAPIIPEPPITDAEWTAMVEAIRASEEDVIALPVPASCTDDATLRACAEALRVTACALGVGLTFYPRKATTHTIREGKERREVVVPAALMVRRMS